MEKKLIKYTVSIYTEDSVGLLNRISAIFQQQGALSWNGWKAKHCPALLRLRKIKRASLSDTPFFKNNSFFNMLALSYLRWHVSLR